MTAYDQIVKLLDSNNVSYDHYEHGPVFTSIDAAKVRGDVKLHQGAKALVLQADQDFILFVFSADLRADLGRLQELLKVKKLRMASRESVKVKTGLEVGSIPPFGSVVGLPTYVDSRLGENTEIAFNAARHDRSIKMKYVDYITIEKPTVFTIE